MSARNPLPDSHQHHADARAETILAAVRASGGRITGPRRAVLDALLTCAAHPTAENLTAQVQRTHPGVAVSTIYRILEHLEELGVLVHVHLGHGPAVYHFTDETHVHLVCNKCGHNTALPTTATQTIATFIHDATAFHPDLTHFSITGHCEHCMPRKRQ